MTIHNIYCSHARYYILYTIYDVYYLFSFRGKNYCLIKIRNTSTQRSTSTQRFYPSTQRFYPSTQRKSGTPGLHTETILHTENNISTQRLSLPLFYNQSVKIRALISTQRFTSTQRWPL